MPRNYLTYINDEQSRENRNSQNRYYNQHSGQSEIRHLDPSDQSAARAHSLTQQHGTGTLQQPNEDYRNGPSRRADNGQYAAAQQNSSHQRRYITPPQRSHPQQSQIDPRSIPSQGFRSDLHSVNPSFMSQQQESAGYGSMTYTGSGVSNSDSSRRRGAPSRYWYCSVSGCPFPGPYLEALYVICLGCHTPRSGDPDRERVEVW